jgi:hypothetical protein
LVAFVCILCTSLLYHFLCAASRVSGDVSDDMHTLVSCGRKRRGQTLGSIIWLRVMSYPPPHMTCILLLIIWLRVMSSSRTQIRP